MSTKPFVQIDHNVEMVNGEVKNDYFTISKDGGVYSWNSFRLSPEQFSELRKLMIEFVK